MHLNCENAGPAVGIRRSRVLAKRTRTNLCGTQISGIASSAGSLRRSDNTARPQACELRRRGSRTIRGRGAKIAAKEQVNGTMPAHCKSVPA